MTGPVSGNMTAMHLLEVEGPARGYFPGPAKSILISKMDLSESPQAELSKFHFQCHLGHIYVGGFIGTEEASLGQRRLEESGSSHRTRSGPA
jgi:hypothetical protein